MDTENLRKLIVAQANAAGQAGWMNLPVSRKIQRDGFLSVPRGAFEQWAVHLSNGGHLAQPWRPISPVGLKQGCDDPFHTDWMLGAGLGVHDMRPSGGYPHFEDLVSAAFEARQKIEVRILNFTCSVLLPGPIVEGRVLQPDKPGKVDWESAGEDRPVLVLRDASPEWLSDVMRTLTGGGAVIIERGGSMAHLVVEARTLSRGPLVRVAGAKNLYRVGSVVEVSPGTGSVRLVEQLRVIDTNDLCPEVKDHRPPPVTSRAQMPAQDSRGKRLGLRIVHKGDSPWDRFGYMEPIRRLDGRDYVAHGSVHWSGHSDSVWAKEGKLFPGRHADNAMLVLHIRGREPGGSLVTVISSPREWADRHEAWEACQAAFYLGKPSEHPSSPETKAAVAELDLRAHKWWLTTSGYLNLGNEALVEHAQRAVKDREALYESCDRGLEAAGQDVIDDLEAYSNLFRRFDTEFAARGMDVRVLDLEGARVEQEGPKVV